ncbi:MAG: hypothetical protein ACYCW6_17010, partial [Candidatus Xenobia bacterium]
IAVMSNDAPPLEAPESPPAASAQVDDFSLLSASKGSPAFDLIGRTWTILISLFPRILGVAAPAWAIYYGVDLLVASVLGQPQAQMPGPYVGALVLLALLSGIAAAVVMGAVAVVVEATIFDQPVPPLEVLTLVRIRIGALMGYGCLIGLMTGMLGIPGFLREVTSGGGTSALPNPTEIFALVMLYLIAWPIVGLTICLAPAASTIEGGGLGYGIARSLGLLSGRRLKLIAGWMCTYGVVWVVHVVISQLIANPTLETIQRLLLTTVDVVGSLPFAIFAALLYQDSDAAERGMQRPEWLSEPEAMTTEEAAPVESPVEAPAKPEAPKTQTAPPTVEAPPASVEAAPARAKAEPKRPKVWDLNIESDDPKVEEPKAEASKAEVPKAETPKVEEPKAEAPKVEAPKAEALKAEAPKVEEPKAEALKAEEPKAEALKAEEPKAEALKAEEPKAEALKAEAPEVEEPKAEAPKVEAPKAEAPKVEAPKVEAPKAEAPKAEAPKAEAPKAEAPKVEAPKAEALKAEAPKAEAPKVEAPKAEAPKVEAAPKAEAQPVAKKVAAAGVTVNLSLQQRLFARAASRRQPYKDPPTQPLTAEQAERTRAFSRKEAPHRRSSDSSDADPVPGSVPAPTPAAWERKLDEPPAPPAPRTE